MPLFCKLKVENKLATVPRGLRYRVLFAAYFSPVSLAVLWGLAFADVILMITGAYFANPEVAGDDIDSYDTKLERVKTVALILMYFVAVVELVVTVCSDPQTYTQYLFLSLLSNTAAAVMYSPVSTTDYTSGYALAVLYVRAIRAFISTGYVQHTFSSLLWVDDEWHPGLSGNPLDAPLMEADVLQQPPPPWSREDDTRYRGLKEKKELSKEEQEEFVVLEKGNEAFSEAGMARLRSASPVLPPQHSSTFEEVKAATTFTNPRPDPTCKGCGVVVDFEGKFCGSCGGGGVDNPPSPDRMSVILCKGCKKPLKVQGSPGAVLCPICRVESPMSKPSSPKNSAFPPSPPPFPYSPPPIPQWDNSAVSMGSPGGVFKCKLCHAPCRVPLNDTPTASKTYRCQNCRSLTSARSSPSPSRASMSMSRSRPASPFQMPPTDTVLQPPPIAEWFEPPSQPVSTDLEFRKQLGERLQEAESQVGRETPRRVM